jgi:hypothetical protein
MNRNKLNKIRREIRSLRQRAGNVHDRELVSVAKQLGRRLSDSGKHPTYESVAFPDLRPISIPSHARAMNPFVVESILDDLEIDCLRLEERLTDNSEEPNADE